MSTEVSAGAKGSQLPKKSSNLPRIPMSEKEGSKVVRISLDTNSGNKKSNRNDSTNIKSSLKTSQQQKQSSASSPRKSLNPNNRLSERNSVMSSGRRSQIIVVPDYLNPQPRFFQDHLKEDMIIEPFDPMASTEEEEEPMPEIFMEEFDDDFDYELLYPDEQVGGDDDFDDFIPSKPSESQLTEEEGEEEGGWEEEEEQGVEEPVDDNLEECDDRSDDEIANERMLKELYQHAFADIMGAKIVRQNESMAPSITKKALDEYFMDREEEKINRCKEAYAGWFYTEGSEILYRRKILSCLDSVLVQERIKYNSIKTEFDKRWGDGQAKQVIIDGALVKFDSYYRETLGKRNRAVQQAAHEMAQKSEKEREVNRYKKELDCLLRLQEQCEKRLQQFRIFERYLEVVRDTSHGEFADVRDIIDRYGVLSQARNGLISRDLKNQDKIERAHNSLKRTMDLRSNELLVYNNYLSELRVYRDNIQEEILQLEETLLHIKTTAASRTLLIGQIKMAINNLYLGLCKQLRRAARIPMDDTLRQLNYIKSSMKEIIKLSRDVKQMLKSAAHAAERDRKERERIERENRRRKYKYGKDKAKANDYRALFGFKPDDL